MNQQHDTLPDLEFLALKAIRTGRALAKNWRIIRPKVDEMTHAKVAAVCY
ncbi:hypothetical protein [Phaeobacter gallaeciensis]|nr:hypothetical protein [Phaeobacter gallaeciensis]